MTPVPDIPRHKGYNLFFSRLFTLEALGHLPKPVRKRGNRTPSQLTAEQIHLSKPLSGNSVSPSVKGDSGTYRLSRLLRALKETHRQTGLLARTQLSMNQQTHHLQEMNTVLQCYLSTTQSSQRCEDLSSVLPSFPEVKMNQFGRSIYSSVIYYFCHPVRWLISGSFKTFKIEDWETREKATEVWRSEKVLEQEHLERYKTNDRGKVKAPVLLHWG